VPFGAFNVPKVPFGAWQQRNAPATSPAGGRSPTERRDTGIGDCRERRDTSIGDAVKGALTALNAGNAPFTAIGMP
jgi:hypothetical protein